MPTTLDSSQYLKNLEQVLHYRDATDSDKDLAVKSVMEEYIKIPPEDVRYSINPDFKVMRESLDYVNTQVVNETYFVAWQLTPIWHNPDQTFINEFLIIKIHGNNPSFKNVVEFFDKMKEINNSTHIVVGDYLSSHQRVYRRLLCRNGFKPLHSLYIRG